MFENDKVSISEVKVTVQTLISHRMACCGQTILVQMMNILALKQDRVFLPSQYSFWELSFLEFQ